MAELDLEAIKRRLADARAKGEWKLFPWKPGGKAAVIAIDAVPPCRDAAAVYADSMEIYGSHCNKNAEFFFHAPTDIAALVAECERLRKVADAARNVIHDGRYMDNGQMRGVVSVYASAMATEPLADALRELDHSRTATPQPERDHPA